MNIAPNELEQVLLKTLSPKHLKTITAKAQRQTIKTLTQTINQQLRQHMKLPAKAIKKRLRYRFDDRPEATLWLGLNPLPLIKFGKPRQTAQGVRVGSNVVDGTFVATMPSGHTGVYRRKTKARLPITEVTQSFEPIRAPLTRALEQTAKQHYEQSILEQLNP